MQPYFFPYIGYFQLMEVVDTYIIADDLNYIKNGFINRNSILINNKSFKISIHLKGASQNKLINEIEVGENTTKLLETIRRTYKKAPYFKDVYPLVENILLNKEKNLARFLGNSLMQIAKYLNMKTTILYSSEIDKDNSLMMSERIIDICQKLNKHHYINPIGGTKLYDKEEFLKKGIQLSFLSRSSSLAYKQFNDDFIPDLSIIDVLMFNSKDEISIMLKQYELL